MRELCRRLRPLVGRKAESLWSYYVTAPTPLARFDAENLIQAFALTHLGSQIQKKSILLPPDPNEAARGEIYLGQILYHGRNVGPVRLRRDELLKHVGMFATTGSGKTNIGYLLVMEFVKHGIPFLVIDWKRSYRSLISRPECRKLNVLTAGRNVRAFLWNPLRPPPKTHIRTWIHIVSEVLEKSHVSGQGVADVFIEHVDRAFAAKGFFDGEGAEYPNFHDVRESLERVQYKGRRQLWQDSCLRILRTFTYGPAAQTFNQRDPVRLETLLDGSVILELDQELPKALRTFLAEAVFRWLHHFRLGQGETASLRHVLILEEVHNLFPKTQIEMQATQGLENVFREIRSFGQGLITLTQHPSLLPVFLLGNTHTLIFLALTHEADIIAARQALFLPRQDEDVLDRLKVGEGILKVKGRVPACHVKFPLVKVEAGAVTDQYLMVNDAEKDLDSLRD
jgi:uncharacterized protein